jgi:formate hydrogenlyase subunit 3/multisubunit Na+/H+ antiporter MnhD subunit
MKAGTIIFIFGGVFIIFLGFFMIIFPENLTTLFAFSVSVTIGIILIGIPFLFEEQENT